MFQVEGSGHAKAQVEKKLSMLEKKTIKTQETWVSYHLYYVHIKNLVSLHTSSNQLENIMGKNSIYSSKKINVCVCDA